MISRCWVKTAWLFRLQDPSPSAWYLVSQPWHECSRWPTTGCVWPPQATLPPPSTASHFSRDRNNTLDLFLDNFFYILSLIMDRHRLKDAKNAWETFQRRAGCCHKNNPSKPQPEETLGRRAAVSDCLELFWWQQLIPSCPLDGGCCGLVGCRQETRVSWDSAYGLSFVALGTPTMKRRAGSPVHVPSPGWLQMDNAAQLCSLSDPWILVETYL